MYKISFMESDPYFSTNEIDSTATMKSGSTLKHINYVPINSGMTAVPMTSTTTNTKYLTPQNILIGTGAICLLILFTKSK